MRGNKYIKVFLIFKMNFGLDKVLNGYGVCYEIIVPTSLMMWKINVMYTPFMYAFHVIFLVL